MIIDVSIENMDHLPEILAVEGVDGIYIPGDRVTPDAWRLTADRIRTAGKKAYFAFPFVMRMEAERYYKSRCDGLRAASFDGYLVRSLDAAAFLMEQDLPGVRVFDQGMYVWNRRAKQQMRQLGADLLTIPYECRAEELDEIGYSDSEMVVYGKLPMMISAQCTRKTCGKCRMERGIKREDAAQITEFMPLRDRRKAEFCEDSHCRFCYSVIYNSVPLWLVDRIPHGCERVRFSFTDEKTGVPSSILRSCMEVSNGSAAIRKQEPQGAFTRGHLKRGVE